MRAQLPTEAHFKLIECAHEVAEHVVVLLGSSNKAVSFSNPFSFLQRKQMIQSSLSGIHQMKTSFMALRDYDHMNHEWEIEVTRLVGKHAKSLASGGDLTNDDIVMVVHEKDDSTYYANVFPQYNKHEVESFGNINATDLRKAFFSQNHGLLPDLSSKLEAIEGKTRKGVISYLRKYALVDDSFGYGYVCQQLWEINNAKEPYEFLPHGIKFKTADALVICGNSVLLGLRGDDCYGANQWALPGGYIEEGETFNSAWLRELNEETEIDVPERAMRNAYKGRLEFEGAKRDERGDYTTQCAIVVLEQNPDGTLPKVKGATDLKKAQWFTFSEVENMKRYMFLDHAGIIEVCRRYVMVRDHFVAAM